MHRRTRRITLAVVITGALAAGGAAFTASNTLPSSDVAGYGSVTVSGATVSAIHNVLDTSGNITEVDLTFSASQAGNTVQAGFSDETALDSCTDANSGTDTSWHCAISHGTGTAGAEPVSGASAFHVAVAQ